MKLLNDRYGITEKDFTRAEIEMVPAYKAVDIGLDRGLIGSYGQDDRCLLYTSLPGAKIYPPTLTNSDLANIKIAKEMGVTGVMQPFVRDHSDLECVKEAHREAGAEDIRLFAKIENMDGVRKLEKLFPVADEIVIARGDLGNAVHLWDLPGVQRQISEKCRAAGRCV